MKFRILYPQKGKGLLYTIQQRYFIWQRWKHMKGQPNIGYWTKEEAVSALRAAIVARYKGTRRLKIISEHIIPQKA